MTKSLIPVLWGFRGMNIRMGPARFPLWGTMDSSPAAAHPHTHSWDQWALIASKRSALLQLECLWILYYSWRLRREASPLW